MDNEAAAIAGFGMTQCLFSLVAYVFIAFALMTIAQKTNTENGWWAWIPILNAILMFQIAQKPIWWILLMLIPFVNIVVLIITWMAIAEIRNKPSWWGILIIVPFVDLIIVAMLAWTD